MGNITQKLAHVMALVYWKENPEWSRHRIFEEITTDLINAHKVEDIEIGIEQAEGDLLLWCR